MFETTLLPLFHLGKVYITPTASSVLEEADIESAALLSRHAQGDWGDLPPEDISANERALQTGERLFSSYPLPQGEQVWVITEADRSTTTILLPADY